MYTTSAVLVEAMHLIGGHPDGPEALVDLLELSSVRISECAQVSMLRKAVSLMAEYRDTPMDFADATLVLLAEQMSCLEIFTLDRRGFSTFRVKGKAFRQVLD
jgi:predicted nucleic acid-binding protein